MADIEHKLLSKLLDPEACAMVDEVGLSPRVFEDPVCRAAFGWMIDYWRETGKAPTRMVMEHEFPTVKLESEVEETTGWMISALRDRHLINRTQNAMRESIVKLDDDPEQTLTELRAALDQILDQAGRISNGDGMPKLWTTADLRPAEQPRWLAKNRLPRGAVSLLVGDEGIGKSLFWVYLAAAVTTGKPLPEFGIRSRDPAHVIVVATEDDWSTTVRPRLEVAGADLAMVHVICTEEDGSGAPVFPRDLHLIIQADPVPALVVVDAWLDTVPSTIQVRDPQQARQALHPWKDVAVATDAAVLLLTHTNRVSSANARDKYGATGELRKKARMTLYAQRDQDGHLVVGPDKANTAAQVTASRFTVRGVPHFPATEDHDGTVPMLAYVGESDQTAQEHIAQTYASGHGSSSRDDLLAWLATYLADGPKWATDLFEAARDNGFSVDQAKRAKKTLHVESDRDGTSNRWFWRLPGQSGLPEDMPEDTRESQECARESV